MSKNGSDKNTGEKRPRSAEGIGNGDGAKVARPAAESGAGSPTMGTATYSPTPYGPHNKPANAGAFRSGPFTSSAPRQSPPIPPTVSNSQSGAGTRSAATGNTNANTGGYLGTSSRRVVACDPTLFPPSVTAAAAAVTQKLQGAGATAATSVAHAPGTGGVKPDAPKPTTGRNSPAVG